MEGDLREARRDLLDARQDLQDERQELLDARRDHQDERQQQLDAREDALNDGGSPSEGDDFLHQLLTDDARQDLDEARETLHDAQQRHLDARQEVLDARTAYQDAAPGERADARERLLDARADVQDARADVQEARETAQDARAGMQEARDDSLDVRELLQDLRGTTAAIEQGDWLNAGLGMANVALDALGIDGDPLGAIASAGLGWVLGAVQFLREPFDVLKGNPGAISSSFQSWDGSSGGLASAADLYRTSSVGQTSCWTGVSGDGYRGASERHATGLQTLAEASRTMSLAMSQGGQATANARGDIMRVISQVVQQIIQICVQALSMSWLSFGSSVALGIARSVQRAVQAAQRMLQRIQQLVQALRRILDIVQKVRQVVQSVKELIEAIGGRAEAPAQPQLSTQAVGYGGNVNQGVSSPVAQGPVTLSVTPQGATLSMPLPSPYPAEAPTGDGRFSQNGWPVNGPLATRTIPGTQIQLRVAEGAAGDVLMYVAGQVHARVEDLNITAPVEVGGPTNEWGYVVKPLGDGWSNHSSGTAIDLNADRHPQGVPNTFTPEQRNEIRVILDEAGGVVRWGGDYSNAAADDMHFEINASYEDVVRAALALRAMGRIE